MRVFGFFLFALQLASVAIAKRNCIVIVDDFGPNNTQRVLLLDGKVVCGGKTVLADLSKQVYIKTYGYDQKDTGGDILHYFLSSWIDVYRSTKNIGKVIDGVGRLVVRETTLLDVNNGFESSDSFAFSEVFGENMVPTWIPLEKFYGFIGQAYKAYFVPTEFWFPLWDKMWDVVLPKVTETMKLPESIDYSFLSIKNANSGVQHLTKILADFETGDIVFLDLDGTLLGGTKNRNDLLWDGTLEFIKDLRNRGVIVVALTVRQYGAEHRWDHGLEFILTKGINSAVISGEKKGENMRNWIKTNNLNPKRIAFADDVTSFLADVFLNVKKMKEGSELPNLTKFVLVSSEIAPYPFSGTEYTHVWGKNLLQEYSPTEAVILVPAMDNARLEQIVAIPSFSDSSSSLSNKK